VRLFASNLLTGALTLVVLALLSLPAEQVLVDGRGATAAAASPHIAPAPPPRTFGVYVDPWHLDEWRRAIGAAPRLVAKFESFSRQRGLDDFLRETERQGVHQAMVSWEPWTPVPTEYGTRLQSLDQIGYRNVDIARGTQDDYIRGFARSLATFRGTVWLRYAHEMNGFWYPWSHGPRNYVRAWHRVVSLVRREARNVRFVWSPNPSLYQPSRAWLQRARAYWPGAAWVDAVGSTMINFGGPKQYGVARFAPRLRALRSAFRKPVMITEANTEYSGRTRWLRDLRRMLAAMPWIRAFIWSQLPSRGKAHMPTAGELDWDVQVDPPSAELLRGIIDDGLRKGRGRWTSTSSSSATEPACRCAGR
jgi:mannan endo-1,4-beta-mannosidase